MMAGRIDRGAPHSACRVSPTVSGTGRVHGCASQGEGHQDSFTEQCPAQLPARKLPEHLYPVDILVGKCSEDLWENTTAYHASVIQQGASSQEYWLPSDGKRVKIDPSSVFLLPLYRGDPNRSLLVLRDPASEDSGVAVYLSKSWWSIEDILKTSNSLRDGLLPVESLGERIVLFVLNCLVFGGLEKGSEADSDVMCFVAHSEREEAKILWQHGEAAAFYTVKPKGSLCDGFTSQWYMLPVLDTAFVRRSHRRRGHMTAMLLDFCRRFPADAALGLSCPVSADMYKVCQKFLQSHPEERDRLWEVEVPGDWCQRENIWLKIQLRRRDSALGESLKDASDESNDRGGETTRQPGCTRDTEVSRQAVPQPCRLDTDSPATSGPFSGGRRTTSVASACSEPLRAPGSQP